MSGFSTPTQPPAPSLLMPQRETAAALCVSERTVFDLAARGELRRVRLPGCCRVLFDRTDVLALIERAKAPPAARGTTATDRPAAPSTPTTTNERNTP